MIIGKELLASCVISFDYEETSAPARWWTVDVVTRCWC